MALAVPLIAAIPVNGGAAEPATYTAYAACGLVESSVPSHECLTTDEKGAFFKSPTDVEYDICIYFPTQKELCATNQMATAETLYVNTITSSIEGLHTVTWKVGGTEVATWTFRVLGPPPPASQPSGDTESQPQPQDSEQRHCDGTFLVRACAKKYDVSIAGINLGARLSTVRATLGKPLRVERDHRQTLCGALQGRGRSELRLPVTRLIYRDHLTVSLQRVSRAENVCSKRNRFKQAVVIGITTTSARDSFPNGIHVGSRLRKLQRVFQPKDMRCTFDSPKAEYNACVLELKRPRWRDQQVLPALSMEIANKRIRRISVVLFHTLS